MLGNLVQTSIAMLLYILCFFRQDCQSLSEMMFWALSNTLVTWSVIAICHYVYFLSEETGRIIASLDIPVERELSDRRVNE